ncbi:S-layer homology domain-containing protein [Paenibacillus sp. MMS20-IR301]|uniref:S-layer homology domain-containing protein n=1 Tax=Paenibacillus sp. MMS20-IR301 TaxID=2895946 RepID=UPI0028E95CA8|nr:S-layer homology domain-containing protein [Paenibacillus sp. MMS20-IR301]WNS41331.1 S-layer homology domain-containing protein [Paenibacillus sp. MMS20-IR301]
MKNNLLSKWTRLSLIVIMLFAVLGAAVAPAGQAFAANDAAVDVQAGVTAGNKSTDVSLSSALGSSVTAAVYATAEFVLKNGVQSDWQAIGLAQAGYKVPDSYLKALESKVAAAKGTFNRATDYARITLAVRALGGNPADFAGYNLIEKLYNNDKITGQTLNNAAYVLLALDSGTYTMPDNAKWTPAKLLAEILAKQNTDGGFTLTTGASDPDMTAMVLAVLAGHKNDPAVNTAGQRAAAWLATAQDKNGGYGDSSESVAQAIIGLSSFGIDPAGAAYSKGNVSLVSKLLSFSAAGGGFAHTAGGSYNQLSTEQALEALVAYSLFSSGGKLYDLSNTPVQNPRVNVLVNVEGPNGTLAEASVYAGNVLNALEKAAAEKGVALVNEAGNYVTGIGGVSAGTFGGYDGWMYVVARGGAWIYPSVGMGDFALAENDRVLVYYGGDNTQVVESVTVSPAQPQPGQDITVKVTQKQWVWNNDTFTSDPVTSPAAGVQVTIGGKTAVTDAAGSAVFAGGLAANKYTLTLTGYLKDNTPAVVRYVQPLTVASAAADRAAFADVKSISPWALESVYTAYDRKLMGGISESSLVFAPKQNITRAEFAALLLRLTGNEPSAATSAQSFSDVKADAWYYGAVNKAKELGMISGVTATAFKPDGLVTREDMAVMIMRAFKLDAASAVAGIGKFSDEDQISEYALTAVRTVTGLGLMSGTGGEFKPSAAVTREMAAAVAVRLP